MGTPENYIPAHSTHDDACPENAVHPTREPPPPRAHPNEANTQYTPYRAVSCRAVPYLNFERENVIGVVPPTDPLCARRHVEGPLPHVIPAAHNPRLSDDPAAAVVPGFVQRPPD